MRCLLRLFVPIAIVSAWIAPAASQDAAAIARQHLHAGTLAAGAAALSGLPPSDVSRTGLGAIKFLQAVEGLSQDLSRHGLEGPRIPMIPILRLPVPPNARPEPLTYDAFRAILQLFARRLADAEATLASVQGADTRLGFDLAEVRLDLDGDGTATENERLWTILGGVDPRLGRPGRGRPGGSVGAPASFPVTFDLGDVLWLRGYSHLLMGIAEFWLAHDFSAQFEQSFHIFFPRAGLPYAMPARADDAPPELEYGAIADLVGFLHLLNWPVADRPQLDSALRHFRSVPDLSRQSWAAILAETDDENEWLPNPRQTNRFPSLPVTQERIDAWLRTMAALADVLDGKKLVPHWRFAQGVNLRRAFLAHERFDPVLWVTGTGLAPFLESGQVISSAEWSDMTAALEGNFFGYAVWFN